MPMRPLSHEARQRQARAQTAEARAQRQAAHHDYGQRRKAVHGPDPRSTARWQKLRLMVLNGEPLCMDPHGIHKGEPVPATEVDHRLGVWERPDLIFDESNLDCYCHECHAIKSGQERRRDKEA